MAQMGNASKADVMNLALNVYNMSQTFVQGSSKNGGPSTRGISLDSNNLPTIYDSAGGQTQLARYSDIKSTVDSSVNSAVSSALATVGNTINSTVSTTVNSAIGKFASSIQEAVSSVNAYLSRLNTRLTQANSDIAQNKADLSSRIDSTNSSISSINSSLSNSITQANSTISQVNTSLTNSIAQTATTLNNNIVTAINAACPAGTPLPWPNNNPPSGWLVCNGAGFDTGSFPQLAQAYPNGTLPDLRGMFIRGLDTTGNFDRDRGRQPLSYQEGSYLCRASDNSVVNMNGRQSFSDMGWDVPDQSRYGSIPSAFSRMSYSFGTFATSYNPNATLYLWNYIGIARPKNVAFNYIVRAA